MNFFKWLSCCLLGFSASLYSQKKESGMEVPLSFFNVEPYAETSPVRSMEDAADDICIWVSDDKNQPVLIVGTDKKRGLETYNIKGERIYSAPFGRINNVDLWDSPLGPIVVGTNRTFNSLDFYLLKIDGSLQLLNRYPTGLKEVYGVSFYKGTESTLVFLSNKRGKVQEYKITLEKSSVSITIQNKYRFNSTVEGIVADVFYKRVYLAEEDKGLWYIDLALAKPKKVLVLKTSRDVLVPDLEGLALADMELGKGYLIMSVQGSSSFAVIDRKTLKLISLFKIVDSDSIDGVQETDGIEISTHPRFSTLIVQDGFNSGENQNFKFIHWENILDYLK